MTKYPNRRTILKTAAAGIGTTFVHGGVSRQLSAAESPNEKLNLACIGVGGRGGANVGRSEESESSCVR